MRCLELEIMRITLPQSELYDVTSGAMVWSQLNNTSGAFNALPQVMLTGAEGLGYSWRLLTARGHATMNVCGDRFSCQLERLLPTLELPLMLTLWLRELLHLSNTRYILRISPGVEDPMRLEIDQKYIDHCIEINKRIVAPGYWYATGVYVDGTAARSYLYGLLSTITLNLRMTLLRLLESLRLRLP